jgi:hypothetical protein
MKSIFVVAATVAALLVATGVQGSPIPGDVSSENYEMETSGRSYDRDDSRSYDRDDGHSYDRDDGHSYDRDDGRSYNSDDD